MADTNFVDGVTPINAQWLNEVNQVVHADDGSAYVGYTPAGTGAVVRNVQDKLREVVSVLDFKNTNGTSVDPTGVEDSATGIQAAVDSVGNYGTIYFPDGIYLVGSTIEVTKTGVSLVGSAKQAAFIKGSGDFDVVHFHAPTATDDTEVYGCSIRDIAINSAITTSTSCALRVTRMGAFNLTDVFIGNHQRGIVLEGIVQSNFVNLSVSASGHTGAVITGAGLIEISEYQSTQSSTYYQTWTTNFTNLVLGGALKSESAIRIESCDGVTFQGGYVARAATYLVSFDEGANSQIASVLFDSVYFDGVSSTIQAVNMPSSTISEESAVISFDNCTFGQCDAGIILGSELGSFNISNCNIINIAGNGISINDNRSGVASSNVRIIGNTLSSCGTDASSYGVKLNYVNTCIVSDNIITGATGAGSAAIYTSGDITNLTVTGNIIKNCTADFDNNATYLNNLTYSSNLSDVADSSFTDGYGTFEVTMSAGTSGTITLDAANNTLGYVKLGKFIHVQGSIVVASVSSPVGALTIGTIPVGLRPGSYTESSDASAVSLRVSGLSASVGAVNGRVLSGGSTISVDSFNGTTSASMADKIQAGTVIAISVTYIGK